MRDDLGPCGAGAGLGSGKGARAVESPIPRRPSKASRPVPPPLGEGVGRLWGKGGTEAPAGEAAGKPLRRPVKLSAPVWSLGEARGEAFALRAPPSATPTAARPTDSNRLAGRGKRKIPPEHPAPAPAESRVGRRLGVPGARPPPSPARGGSLGARGATGRGAAGGGGSPSPGRDRTSSVSPLTPGLSPLWTGPGSRSAHLGVLSVPSRRVGADLARLSARGHPTPPSRVDVNTSWATNELPHGIQIQSDVRAAPPESRLGRVGFTSKKTLPTRRPAPDPHAARGGNGVRRTRGRDWEPTHNMKRVGQHVWAVYVWRGVNCLSL